MTRHPVLLTTREVATAAGVDPSTVRRWVDSGRLAAARLPGGRLRISAEAVAAILTPRAAGDDAAAADEARSA